MLTRAKFGHWLKAHGFTRDPTSDSEVIEYRKRIENRVITVQLWKDGGHRASHFLNGVMNTIPTDFKDIPGMETAIVHEETRTDHPPRVKLSGPVMILDEDGLHITN